MPLLSFHYLLPCLLLRILFFEVLLFLYTRGVIVHPFNCNLCYFHINMPF